MANVVNCTIGDTLAGLVLYPVHAQDTPPERAGEKCCGQIDRSAKCCVFVLDNESNSLRFVQPPATYLVIISAPVEGDRCGFGITSNQN